MSDDSNTLELGSGRRWWRVVLTIVCVVAVILASVALPLFAGDAAPATQFDLGQPLSAGAAGGGVPIPGGALGALSAVQETNAGSSTGSASTNPYNSLNQEVHFVVRTDEPSYWRTGSFDTYTGQGWERTGDSEPFDGTTSVEGAGSGQVNYEVTLAKSATALPTVWQPSSLSLGSQSLELNPGRAITSQESVPSGTTYQGTSVKPPDDPELLRTAGQEYPDNIEATYLGLPSTDDAARVGAFTDDLTTDAETPYETATQIESWLETNKEYSLNASHNRENGSIASEFIFEMDTGYCEYYASAMTVMLRSQDIPARYVVGYATGEQTGPNEYTVRGMHAHAWVEVYFPDVGWVRFDPTPSQERQEVEEETLEETPTPTPSPTPPEADGTSTPRETTETTTETVTPTQTETAQPPSLNVSLNRTAVPGATVEVSVARAGEAVEGAEVLFNGDSIGLTDAEGLVVGDVPYTRELNITVQPSTETVGAVPPPDDVAYNVPAYAPQTAANNTSYTLDTNASITFIGEVHSNATVTLVATIDDVPVRDATVTRNGTEIGQTDDRGRFELRLMNDPGDYEYAVSRGSVSGERTVSIRQLELTKSVNWPVTLPFAPVTLNATLGDEPLPYANLSVSGAFIGTTNANGTATSRLPPTESVTLAVSARGQRAEVSVKGMLSTLGGVLAGLLVGLAALFGGAYRRGVTPRAVVGRIGQGIRRGYQMVLIAVVSVSDVLSHAVERLFESLSQALERLIELANELRARTKTPAEVASIIANGVLAWATSTAATLQALPVLLFAWGRELTTEEASESPAGADEETVPENPESAAARERIRKSWRRFLAMLPLGPVRTLTPGEVARIAVEDAKLPAEPVERLRDAYREVAYDGVDPESRQTVAEEAIDSLDPDGSNESGPAEGQPPESTRSSDAGGDAP